MSVADWVSAIGFSIGILGTGLAWISIARPASRSPRRLRIRIFILLAISAIGGTTAVAGFIYERESATQLRNAMRQDVVQELQKTPAEYRTFDDLLKIAQKKYQGRSTPLGPLLQSVLYALVEEDRIKGPTMQYSQGSPPILNDVTVYCMKCSPRS
jgi:hypothetical protein